MNAICIKEFTFLRISTFEEAFISTVGIIYELRRHPSYGWQAIIPDLEYPLYGLDTLKVIEHFRELV